MMRTASRAGLARFAERAVGKDALNTHLALLMWLVMIAAVLAGVFLPH